MPARTVTNRLFDALALRDMDRIVWCFADNASWANVPHEPAVGRDAIRDMFGFIVARCERLQWDIVSASYTGDTAWVERVDRFWLNGRELAVQCNGVFRVDERTELITEVRDYVDLAPWRALLAEAGVTR